MRWLRRAVVVGWVAVAACRAPTAKAPAAESAPRGPTAQQMAAVQPDFLPAFEELQRAVTVGDDVVARRILRGIEARAPTGAALSLAQAFDRILAGREAVSELHIALVVRPEAKAGGGAPPSAAANANTATQVAPAPTTTPPATTAPSTAGTSTAAKPNAAEEAPPSRMEARLLFVVENISAVPIELRPGPASLQVTKTSVGRLKMVRPGEPMVGGEQQSTETHPYAEIRDLRLEPGRTVEIELARFFIDVPESDLAVRLTFDLDLRSGSIVRDGRELPAMHVPVAGCEATCWGKLVCPELKASPESLEEYVLRASAITAQCALEIAVRMPPEDRNRALDLLAAQEREISEPHLVELGPALRWMTQDPSLGGDPKLWRAYLRARAGAKSKSRPKLELPVRTE